MRHEALRVAEGNRRYRTMIGVGGIGAGTFFALDGNATLGREESRAGHFLDRRDYCKLHIISHYVQALLGSPFSTIPIGQVGDDEQGRRLLGEMAAAGLDTRYVRVVSGVPTLYSFCFLYPDGDGGNLTTDDSASSRVDAAQVESAEREFAAHAGHGVALAVPEVPLEAREAILKLGTRHGFFRVASFTAGELSRESTRSLAGYADLLALNRDEAAAFGGAPSAAASPTAAIEAAVRLAVGRHPTLMLTITAGAGGSWLWDGSDLHHLPALPVVVANTAGAGDAHVSGIIAGLAAGLDAAAAHEVAVLTAAYSVTSPHTISPGLDRPALWALARSAGMTLSPEVRQLLEEDR